MERHLKTQIRFFSAVAIVPFVIGFGAVYSFGLFFILLIFGAVPAFAVLLVGSAVLLVAGVRRARQDGRVAAIFIAPVLLAATVLASWPLLQAGAWLGSLSRLGFNRSHYEAIIAKARSGGTTTAFAEDGGVTYAIDVGPPVRVAFNPDGILDNWSGIVFDPTGEVMKAHGFDASGRFYAPDRITKLFGGDLVSCRHLWGNYYNCSFT
jgi:hypothetical protein